MSGSFKRRVLLEETLRRWGMDEMNQPESARKEGEWENDKPAEIKKNSDRVSVQQLSGEFTQNFWNVAKI